MFSKVRKKFFIIQKKISKQFKKIYLNTFVHSKRGKYKYKLIKMSQNLKKKGETIRRT